MKQLSQLAIGDHAIIVKITAAEPVKSRLFSMGIVRGASVTLKDHTFSRQTFDVTVGETDIALRAEEARTVWVRSA